MIALLYVTVEQLWGGVD